MTAADPSSGEQSVVVELLLIRHAKSAWPEGVADRDRPLNRRGEAAAGAVGAFLRGADLLPDVVVASPARRTVLTAQGVFGTPPPEHRSEERSEPGRAAPRSDQPELRLDERVYDDDVVAVVAELVASVPAGATVAVVGHEPGIVEAARWVCGAQVQVPTGCVLWCTVRAPLEPGAGVLRLVLPPRLLGVASGVTGARRPSAGSAKNS